MGCGHPLPPGEAATPSMRPGRLTGVIYGLVAAVGWGVSAVAATHAASTPDWMARAGSRLPNGTKRLANSLLFRPAPQRPQLPVLVVAGEAAGGGGDVACVDAGPGKEFRARS